MESIVSLKQSFSKPMNEIRQSLEELDNVVLIVMGILLLILVPVLDYQLQLQSLVTH